MAVSAMLDAPLVVGPLVQVSRKIMIEFAGIGPERLVFVTVSHNSPPMGSFVDRSGSFADPETTLKN
jgi:hypothetical protein